MSDEQTDYKGLGKRDELLRCLRSGTTRENHRECP
jgi:hypothetical protein